MKTAVWRSIDEGPDTLAKAVMEQGVVAVEEVISGSVLAELQRAYDVQICRVHANKTKRPQDRHPEGWLEVPRIFELDSTFEKLMDLPLALSIAVRILGVDLELASSGELDHKSAGTPTSFCGWHTDFIWMASSPFRRQLFWLACYYFLNDITEDMGPLVVLPGSHKSPSFPPDTLNVPSGHGRMIDNSVMLTGPAGSALFFNNEIWHMSPSNLSQRPRELIKVHYKPSWMKPWGGNRRPTSEYILRQTCPLRQQLLGYYEYDNVPWQYGDDATATRYPAAQFLEQRTRRM